MTSRRRAMSLLEALISLLIVGMMAAAGLSAAGHAARVKAISRDRVVGDRLASIMLDEVMSKRAVHSPISSVDRIDRNRFASIDDYQSYRQSPPRDLSGAVLEPTAWEWSVDVERCDTAGRANVNGAMRRITIRVSRDGVIKSTVSAVAGGALAEAAP